MWIGWLAVAVAVVAPAGGSACAAEAGGVYRRRADEVTREIVASYWEPDARLYSERPGGEAATVWSGGVMFSALVGAARHDPKTYTPLLEAYYRGLDTYWDRRASIPGYEPTPTQGGNDKYYDDNAWLVISLVEAYEVTGSNAYLRRAKQALKFVVSGHDDQRGGGIWWHEQHKDGTKNTCVTAPAAVGCLRVAEHSSKRDKTRLIQFAQDLVGWTTATLRRPDGLYADRIEVESGKVHDYPLTYNTALMIRAYLGLFRATGKQETFDEAVRLGEAAQAFVQDDTRAYRDDFKWSHLMLEADLALYRATGDERYFERAKATADYYYEVWRDRRPAELIELASIARALWLMAGVEAEDAKSE
jgi:uncharacterized protein YyaL (SSP411 family)